MVGNNYESSVFRTTEGPWMESRESPGPCLHPPAPSFRGRGDHPVAAASCCPKPGLACWGFDKGNRPVAPLPFRRVQTSTSTSTSTSNSSTSAHLRTEPSRASLQLSTLETTRTAAARWRHHWRHTTGKHHSAPQSWAEGQFARRVQADRRTPTPPAPRPLRTSTTFAALHPLPLASI